MNGRHKIYYARKGARLTHKQAQVCGERFEHIREASGALTPDAIVTDARADESPIHPFFEWNDARAAKAHRLERARSLVRDVVHVYQATEGTAPEEVRAFLHISEGIECYEPVDVVAADDDLSAQVVRRAYKELQGWQKRYKQYQQLQPIVSRIETILSEAALGEAA